MNSENIYITGFMGSGKSTIGPILANTLGWDFFDLDDVIEKKTGKKITEIFNESGEEFFRKLEHEELKELSGKKNLIISLGGGTIAYHSNFKILKQTGKIVYLKTSLDSVYERLRFKKDRPLINSIEEKNLSREEVLESLNKLLTEREKFYNKADIIIDTDKISVGKTVDKIAKLISKD